MDKLEEINNKGENKTEILNESKLKNMDNIYNWFSSIGFLGVITSLSMGFYKMFVYANYDDDSYFSDSDMNVNTYVGGDAYNFIINASYATGYFVLALMCMLFSCTMLILKAMGKNKIGDNQS